MAKSRTLEQKRAERALECVQNVKHSSQIKSSDYVGFAKRAPSNIQTSGLGQTLAYWRSKGKGKSDEAGEVIYKDVSKWVCSRISSSDRDDLLTIITQCSTSEYRRATTEAMAFLNWLRRFAEAELGDEK